MAHMRMVHQDEEGHMVKEKVPIPETRHLDTLKHFERKFEEKGLHRFERHLADGPRGIGAPPPKSGRGGKFTWEGPDRIIDSELDPLPTAIDRNNPNYEDEGEAELDEVAKEALVGEVEVAKVAEAKAGVARVDFAPPLMQDLQ